MRRTIQRSEELTGGQEKERTNCVAQRSNILYRRGYRLSAAEISIHITCYYSRGQEVPQSERTRLAAPNIYSHSRRAHTTHIF